MSFPSSLYPSSPDRLLASYWLFQPSPGTGVPYPIEVAPADEGDPAVHVNLNLADDDSQGFLDVLNAATIGEAWEYITGVAATVTVREVAYPIFGVDDEVIGWQENRIMSVTTSMAAGYAADSLWPVLLRGDGWLHHDSVSEAQRAEMVYPNPDLDGSPSEYTVDITAPLRVTIPKLANVDSVPITLPIERRYADGTVEADGTIGAARWEIAPTHAGMADSGTWRAPTPLSAIRNLIGQHGTQGPSYTWFPENYEDPEYDPEEDGEPEERPVFEPWPGDAPHLTVPVRPFSYQGAIRIRPNQSDPGFDVGLIVVSEDLGTPNFEADWNESNQPYFTAYATDGPFAGVDPYSGYRVQAEHLECDLIPKSPFDAGLDETAIAAPPLTHDLTLEVGGEFDAYAWTSGLRIVVTALVGDAHAMHDFRIDDTAADAMAEWAASGDGLLYDGALGTLPRPYGGATGTFLGRTITAEGPYALDVIRTEDGPVAVLVQDGQLIVWRSGTLLWDGPLVDALPADVVAATDADAPPVVDYRFVLPEWPHPTGAVFARGRWLAFQLAGRGDRGYPASGGVVPPVVFSLVEEPP